MRRLYILALTLLIVGAVYADQITFSTYYPAPFGVYREMRIMRVAIGDTYHKAGDHPWDTDGGAPEADEIHQDADLVVEGRVGIGTAQPKAILDLDVSNRADGDKTGFLPPRMTQAQLDTIEGAAEEGSVAYNDDQDELVYHDGTSWKSAYGVKTWESDWIAVTKKKIYLNGGVDERGNLINLSHNLGTSSLFIQVLYAKDTGSFPTAPNLNTITYNTAASDSNIDWRSVHSGTLVQGIKNNSIDKLVTGHENVAIWADSPIKWNGMREANGWIKIIAIAP